LKSTHNTQDPSRRYVLVTPVRDEERYLPLTIDSIVKQTTRPVEWVIVNDGSRDSTPQIIDDATRSYSWIRAVHRLDRGYRQSGGGIVAAFLEGLKSLQTHDWSFLCKLDGDLSFDPSFFESALQKLEDDATIGIGGGVLYYHREDGRRVLETHPRFHVRGAVKIYRRKCWDAMGGLWVGPGWDTVDEVKANMLGWRSQSFFDLHMTHHRPTGATCGRWGGVVKDGRIDYVVGYHPLFMLAKCARRLKSWPYVVASGAMLCGFLSGYLKRLPRVNDPKLIGYLRRQQMNRLLGRESIWK
jgi:poly-beta-1,6-N-acetyl-D-glucosamine synthase